MVCSKLAELPDTDVNNMVARVLELTAADGFTDEMRAERARRVLTDAAAQDCPDQSARIAADLGWQLLPPHLAVIELVGDRACRDPHPSR